ncbi:MAG: HAD family hydrolase [Ignavibacterium sp.]|jgi:HAD superfamily hydrolase (TIGR01509 family)|nr:HAD family hydrolase [Ignavibacterium sp.]MDX9712739.1 HAD family hydrolase [Ignavibacteriaceae bacterium]MEB2355855.1 HAD family hydrolase [Ignavibacteriales bacterium]GIK21961.1 MAG: pyrophosphatase PpaX [Ignavibacteriota bacterium]
MKSRFKGIIFDVDGTLTYTNQLIFDSFNHITKKYLGKTFSDEEIIALFGPTEDVILKEMCKDEYDIARKEYYQYYKENHNIARTYAGIETLIEDLFNNKIILGVFTGKGRTSALITLDELGLTDYFGLIVSGDDVVNHKPHPEGIIQFLEQYNLSPDEVLMVGDAPSDIKAAKAAGVSIASVIWDSYSEEEVKKLNSNNLFHSVDELRSFIFS